MKSIFKKSILKRVSKVTVMIVGVCFIIAVNTNTVNAEEKAQWRDLCAEVSEIAETIMERRQEGVSMQKMMDIIAYGTGSKGATNITETLIMKAYEIPRYRVKDNRERAVQEFKNRWYLACVKDIRKNNE